MTFIYVLFTIMLSCAASTMGFASSADFKSEIAAAKNGMEGVNIARNLFEDHREKPDTDFSDHVATYISTGTLDGSKLNLSDKIATPDETADFFRAFLAAAYRGETLSEKFSQELGKHSGQKVKAHISGAIVLAQLAEHLVQNPYTYINKEVYSFDAGSVFKEYRDYADGIIKPSREKDQAWREAIDAVPLTDRETHKISLELDFKRTRDLAKKEKDLAPFKDFEKSVANTIYDHLDPNADYSSFHPDIKHYMGTSEWPRILEEAKALDSRDRSKTINIKFNFSLGYIKKLQNISSAVENENYKIAQQSYVKLGFDKLEDPLLAQDPLIKASPLFPLSQELTSTLKEARAYIKSMEDHKEVQDLIRNYNAYKASLEKYKSSLDRLTSEEADELKKQLWTMYKDNSSLSKEDSVKHTFQISLKKIVEDVIATIAPTQEDKQLIVDSAAPIFKSITEKGQLPANYEQILTECKRKLLDQPLPALTEKELQAAILKTLDDVIAKPSTALNQWNNEYKAIKEMYFAAESSIPLNDSLLQYIQKKMKNRVALRRYNEERSQFLEKEISKALNNMTFIHKQRNQGKEEQILKTLPEALQNGFKKDLLRCFEGIFDQYDDWTDKSKIKNIYDAYEKKAEEIRENEQAAAQAQELLKQKVEEFDTAARTILAINHPLYRWLNSGNPTIIVKLTALDQKIFEARLTSVKNYCAQSVMKFWNLATPEETKEKVIIDAFWTMFNAFCKHSAVPILQQGSMRDEDKAALKSEFTKFQEALTTYRQKKV